MRMIENQEFGQSKMSLDIISYTKAAFVSKSVH